MSKLVCYGGAGTTTGANFLLELGGKKILIDCGMIQGNADSDIHNRKSFDYDPASIEILFVTHAHIDHIGLIPKLYKEGFRGEIYSTEETKSIAELLLMDAAKIGHEENQVLYTPNYVVESLNLWKSLPYHSVKDLGQFKVELYDAGHVLGSTMFKFTTQEGKSMLFSGDIGNSPSPILHDVEKVSGLDYILLESVYGDRNHEDKELRDQKFQRVVEDSIKRGGTLLIPAFSLERTQVLLYKLDELFESKKIPSAPVYLDSPLAIRVTEIYERVKGSEHFEFKQLHKTPRWQDSGEIANVTGPKIIIAGSGMSTAGRILGHEERFLPDPNSTILLVGYQGVGTLGRELAEGVKSVVIDGHKVEVKARVEKIDGFSAHADSNALVEFVFHSAQTLKKTFVAMGEPHSSIFLAQRLRDELEIDAVVAEKGKVYELDLLN